MAPDQETPPTTLARRPPGGRAFVVFWPQLAYLWGRDTAPGFGHRGRCFAGGTLVEPLMRKCCSPWRGGLAGLACFGLLAFGLLAFGLLALAQPIAAVEPGLL